MTFSIVAYDPETGEIGVAVQSKAFGVGSLVAWVKEGVGAVSTQSLVNVSLGPKGLELMGEGRNPDQVLEHFRTIDDGIERRQLGILSIQHGSFTFTGESCMGWAGGIKGDNYACQGNILTGESVIIAMAKTFESTKGDLAERMLAALEAGQKAGGDARGRQSATIIVEAKGKGRAGYGDRKIDLRVEDNERPIDELIRINEISKMNSVIYQAMVKSSEDKQAGIDLLNTAINNRRDRPFDEAWMSLALLHYMNDDKENSLAQLKICFEINPGMKNIFEHYPNLGLGFDDEFVREALELI